MTVIMDKDTVAGAATAAALSVEGLTKVFQPDRSRRIVALDGLDLAIAEGEIFGLLGPNGSGKSTAIKLMLGLLFPTAGRVRIFGRDNDELAVKAAIGYLPENPYYYRYLTGPELLDFYGAIYGIPAAEIPARREEMLALVGLERARHQPLRNYSKGMLERIGLASALLNNPRFLILDEPTTGLDPIGSREMRNLFLRLRDEGKTILLSSHYLSEVERICGRVGILHRGRLMDIGAIGDLMSKWGAENVEDLFIKVIECENR